MADVKEDRKSARAARGLVPGRWAIQKDAMRLLASSTFGDSLFKDNGAVDHRNIVDDMGNGISVLHVDGALSYRSDFFSAWLGMDTYDSISAAFASLLADDGCRGVILDINSPGGEVAGCADLANMIFGARGSKPYGIVARTGGVMASAAYWLGSSAEKVYTSEQGVLGSIGVLCAYDAGVAADETLIVSDLSPNKAPSPSDPEGLSLIKKTLNDLASVFITGVARNRGTDYQDVLLNYGQGGTFVGDGAVRAGLADGVLSLDGLMEQMTSQDKHTEASMAEQKTQAAATAAPSADLEAARQAAVAEERTRVSGIQAAFKTLGMEDECEKFIAEGKSVAEATAFALGKCKECLAAAASTPPAKTPSDPSAAALQGRLSDEQKALIRKGLAADASAQNGIKGGQGQDMSDEKRRDAIAKAAADRYYGRK